jgi:hypothetical protein
MMMTFQSAKWNASVSLLMFKRILNIMPESAASARSIQPLMTRKMFPTKMIPAAVSTRCMIIDLLRNVPLASRPVYKVAFSEATL